MSSAGLTKKVGFNILNAARTLFSGFSRHGISFGGGRNYYETFGYKRALTYQDCKEKYDRQDIAKRLIDMPADALWTAPPSFDLTPKLDILLKTLNQGLALWDVCNRADKLAGMGLYSTILIGVDDGRPLNKPARSNGKIQITFLQPYSCESLTVDSYETDPNNPRFGKPLMYVLRGMTIGESGNALRSISRAATPVHWSRVIHVVEGALENEITGTPRMMVVYNLLDDLMKIGGGSAEIYWLNARGGLHIDVDKELDLDVDDAADLTQEVDDYVHNLARVIRTRGTEVKTLNSAVADPSLSFAVTLSLVSAATNIPQRILVGSEAGQLAAEQDRANWSDHIENRRKNFAEPRVLKSLVTRLFMYGMIDESDLLNTVAVWPEAFKLNPLERAKTSAQQARSAANLATAIDKVNTLLSPDEARRIIALAAPKVSVDGHAGL